MRYFGLDVHKYYCEGAELLLENMIRRFRFPNERKERKRLATLFSPPTGLEMGCVDVTIILELGVKAMQQYSDEFKEQVLAEVD
ncbi:hypothetical protein V3F56_13955 [Moorellaceae bacterium AZ2]